MRLSSQGTKFLIGTAGAPGIPTTGITKAAPPVLTWGTIPPAYADGDVVFVQGFNWKSIDNKIFRLANVGTPANTAELEGADTTAEVADAAMGTLMEVVFAESCMATITISGPAGTTIDVTTLCDTARETIDGMPGISTWQATGFWDAQDPMQASLRALYRSGMKVPIELIFNDGSGMMFMGTVNQFDVTVGVDQAVAYSVGGNISGPITDLPVNPALAMTMMAVPMGQSGGTMLQPPPAPEPAQPSA